MRELLYVRAFGSVRIGDQIHRMRDHQRKFFTPKDRNVAVAGCVTAPPPINRSIRVTRFPMQARPRRIP